MQTGLLFTILAFLKTIFFTVVYCIYTSAWPDCMSVNCGNSNQTFKEGREKDYRGSD